MHGDSWFPFFGLGHWALGLLVWLVWLVIIVAITGLFKMLFSNS